MDNLIYLYNNKYPMFQWGMKPISDLPKENGHYLCLRNVGYTQKRLTWEVLQFVTNLEAFCEFDFEDKTEPGFVEYSSEYGFYEIDDVVYWAYLPEIKDF